MNHESLITAACEQAGVTKIRDNSFREGLVLLVDEINDTDKLSPQGQELFRQELISYLAARLQVDDYAHRHPELLKVPIEKPVVVLGMPRSGTTLLSYLLDADPARRSVLRWQTLQPVPPAPAENLRDDPRCLQMIAADKLQEENPIKPLHYESPDGPTECVFVQAQDFKSLYWESHMPYKRYSDWMLECDMSSAYDYHRRFLQVLQGGNPAAWNLKMPSHALYIHWLLKAYPDARILWIHRDPYKAMGSLCSLIAAAQSLFMGAPDIEFISRNYPLQMAEHLRRPMAVKDALGEERIFDMYYERLMENPIDEMRKVYAHLGDEFTPEAEAGMRRWLEANPQGKFGKHSYNLEQFNLSKEKLRPYFADYVRRFGIKPEA